MLYIERAIFLRAVSENPSIPLKLLENYGSRAVLLKTPEKQFLWDAKFSRINVILPESFSLSMYC